ncbi:hypothetical protein ACTXT7_013233 [Hymenolepis weldensis]
MVTKKASTENLLREVQRAPGRHWLRYLMLCDSTLRTFLKKMIFKRCYVTNRSINLMGLGWIDELNLIRFPDESKTC